MAGLQTGQPSKRAWVDRANEFEFDPQPMEEIKSYIDLVSEQWDQSLSRLKAFVER